MGFRIFKTSETSTVNGPIPRYQLRPSSTAAGKPRGGRDGDDVRWKPSSWGSISTDMAGSARGLPEFSTRMGGCRGKLGAGVIAWAQTARKVAGCKSEVGGLSRDSFGRVTAGDAYQLLMRWEKETGRTREERPAWVALTDRLAGVRATNNLNNPVCERQGWAANLGRKARARCPADGRTTDVR